MAEPVPVIEVSELTKRYDPPEPGLLAVEHISARALPICLLNVSRSPRVGRSIGA
jgi:hypothetical protein